MAYAGGTPAGFGSTGGWGQLAPSRTFGGGGGSPSPFWNVSGSSSFGGKPITMANIGGQYKQYQNVFGPPTAVDLSKIPQVRVPSITAPHITPATVATPAQLEQRIAAVYAPRYAELNRQQQLQDQALMGAAASAGLAESGVALGARQIQGEAFGRERATLQGAQAEQRLGAEMAVVMQNAANIQAANLANAQLDVGAQTANAQAILAGNTANAENYMRAIGINAQIADSYRNSFMNFMTEQQKMQMQRDSMSMQFNSSLLDAMLKQAGIEQQASQFAATQGLEQQKLEMARAAPGGEFGYNPYAAGTGAVTRDVQGFPVYSGTAARSPTAGWWNSSMAQQSPTLSRVGRVFGSLGVGGI
jgi:hypothetical protein